MGGGLRRRQYENRFFQGKEVYKGEEAEAFEIVKKLGNMRFVAQIRAGMSCLRTVRL